MRYIYLHGWCSGTQSAKARFFSHRFAEYRHELLAPDLNFPDFQTLTLSRQLRQVSDLIEEAGEVMIIGASMGAMLALILAESYQQIKGLVLLAPGIIFYPQAMQFLTEAQHAQWQKTGYLPLMHHAYGEKRLLHYDFLRDLQDFGEVEFRCPLPGLVFHGLADDAVPFEHSKTFCAIRPHLKLYPLESDHGLVNVLDGIWLRAKPFLLPEST